MPAFLIKIHWYTSRMRNISHIFCNFAPNLKRKVSSSSRNRQLQVTQKAQEATHVGCRSVFGCRCLAIPSSWHRRRPTFSMYKLNALLGSWRARKNAKWKNFFFLCLPLACSWRQAHSVPAARMMIQEQSNHHQSSLTSSRTMHLDVTKPPFRTSWHPKRVTPSRKSKS